MPDQKNYNAAVEELYEKKRESFHAMQEMMKVDQSQWSPEDETRWSALDAELIQTDKDIEQTEAAAAREARMAVIEEAKDRQRVQDRSTPDEMRSYREGRLPGRTHDQLESLCFNAWARPAIASEEERFACKQRNFNNYAQEINIRIFQPGQFNTQAPHCVDNGASIRRAIEQRAQSTSTGSAGGYLSPQGMMQSIEIALLQWGSMRRSSSVIRAGDGRPIPWPTVNDTDQTGVIVGEGAATTEGTITFGQVTTSPHLYSSYYIPVSEQLMQDSATNIEGMLGGLLGTRIGRKQNSDFTVGTGSSQPSGLLQTTTAAGVALNADNAPTFANLIDIKHSVDPAYRMMGHGWMFSDTVLASIKKIVDTAGAPIWQAGLASGEPNTIDGDPYFINQDMPTAAATGTKSMAYGQLDKYKIHDALDIQIRRLTEIAAYNHQIVFLAFMRSDGVLLDAGTNPVKHATNP